MQLAKVGGERLVGWASGLCAVHCLAHPALILLLPVAALSEAAEALVLAGLVVLAPVLLWTGYRQHGRQTPAVPVAVAVLLWGAALLEVVPEPGKAFLIAAGGGFSFWGLTWSRRLVEACSCGECAAGATQERSAF
jgi:hypothetical protein